MSESDYSSYFGEAAVRISRNWAIKPISLAFRVGLGNYHGTGGCVG